jgi:hypothetical protein
VSGDYHAAVLENAVCGVNFGRRCAWAKLANAAFVENGSDAKRLRKTSQDIAGCEQGGKINIFTINSSITKLSTVTNLITSIYYIHLLFELLIYANSVCSI